MDEALAFLLDQWKDCDEQTLKKIKFAYETGAREATDAYQNRVLEIKALIVKPLNILQKVES